MVSRNKIVTTVIIFLLLSVLFSGCIEEKKDRSGARINTERSSGGLISKLNPIHQKKKIYLKSA